MTRGGRPAGLDEEEEAAGFVAVDVDDESDARISAILLLLVLLSSLAVPSALLRELLEKFRRAGEAEQLLLPRETAASCLVKHLTARPSCDDSSEVPVRIAAMIGRADAQLVDADIRAKAIDEKREAKKLRPSRLDCSQLTLYC